MVILTSVNDCLGMHLSATFDGNCKATLFVELYSCYNTLCQRSPDTCFKVLACRRRWVQDRTLHVSLEPKLLVLVDDVKRLNLLSHT